MLCALTHNANIILPRCIRAKLRLIRISPQFSCVASSQTFLRLVVICWCCWLPQTHCYWWIMEDGSELYTQNGTLIMTILLFRNALDCQVMRVVVLIVIFSFFDFYPRCRIARLFIRSSFYNPFSSFPCILFVIATFQWFLLLYVFWSLSSSLLQMIYATISLAVFFAQIIIV